MSLEPRIANLTSAMSSWNASEVLAALAADITANGTNCTVDDYNTNEGLTIGFSAVGENQQVNLRKSGANTIAVSIEPAGTITDAGNSSPTAPTGTSADWSGAHQEPNWDVSLGSPGAGSRLWFVTVPDAFFVIITDTGNDYMLNIIHAGRVYAPTNSSGAPAAGQDGLGYMAGVPDNGIGTVNDWIGASSPCSSLHWATGEWSDHASWVSAPSTIHTPSAAHVTYRPLTAPFLQAADINGTTSDGSVGAAKYIRQLPTQEIPRTVYTEPGVGDQGWIVYNDSILSAIECLIWLESVTP
jgi:hypothetical protein